MSYSETYGVHVARLKGASTWMSQQISPESVVLLGRGVAVSGCAVGHVIGPG